MFRDPEIFAWKVSEFRKTVNAVRAKMTRQVYRRGKAGREEKPETNGIITDVEKSSLFVTLSRYNMCGRVVYTKYTSALCECM